jgi:hypothetical protein
MGRLRISAPARRFPKPQTQTEKRSAIMAKRTSARRRHLPPPRRYTYTPELMASGRHRYEHTADTITDIAVDFGIHKTTLQRPTGSTRWSGR